MNLAPASAWPALVSPRRAADLRAVVAWHGAWVAMAGLVAVGARIFEPRLEWPLLIALIVTALPGLAGLWLARRDGPGERSVLLGVWSVAAVAVCALSGGLTGSLAGFVFTPLAAGLVLGGEGLALGGAAAGATAALVGLVSVLLGGPPRDDPTLAAIAGMLAALALASAVRVA
ncbi:hypothetical protein BH10PSE2_BH10PSE2_01780 [soil metagenome]